MDAPTLLVHHAVMPPAQGDEVLELGGTAVRPVDDVVPFNPQMYVDAGRREVDGLTDGRVASPPLGA
jgi:hypothetical protein